MLPADFTVKFPPPAAAAKPTTPTRPEQLSSPTESPVDDLDDLTDALASASDEKFKRFLDALAKLSVR